MPLIKELVSFSKDREADRAALARSGDIVAVNITDIPLRPADEETLHPAKYD